MSPQPLLSLSAAPQGAPSSRQNWPLLASALGVALLLAACSKPAVTEEPVRAVRLMTVGPDAMQSSQEFAGEVRPRVESGCSPCARASLGQMNGMRIRPSRWRSLCLARKQAGSPVPVAGG